jgi:hypothetical protein
MGFPFAELADLGKVFCPNLKTEMTANPRAMCAQPAIMGLLRRAR